MDVMVYWSKDGVGKGAVDHYSSPYNKGWSMNRVEFWEVAARPDTGEQVSKWGIRIVDPSTSISEHESRDKGARDEAGEREAAWSWLPGLSRAASGFDEYEAWLEENVDAIQVNGYPWWQAERVSETARIADGLDALIGQECS